MALSAFGQNAAAINTAFDGANPLIQRALLIADLRQTTHQSNGGKNFE